jgi:acetylornithine deacetylase/succinyl-diaminopimelate desuccinylase-like protein
MISADAGFPRVLRFGEKGMIWLSLHAHGRSAHAAHVHRGDSAIDKLLAGNAVQLTRSLASAWAADNIQVNANLSSGHCDVVAAALHPLEMMIASRTGEGIQAVGGAGARGAGRCVERVARLAADLIGSTAWAIRKGWGTGRI